MITFRHFIIEGSHPFLIPTLNLSHIKENNFHPITLSAAPLHSTLIKFKTMSCNWVKKSFKRKIDWDLPCVAHSWRNWIGKREKLNNITSFRFQHIHFFQIGDGRRSKWWGISLDLLDCFRVFGSLLWYYKFIIHSNKYTYSNDKKYRYKDFRFVGLSPIIYW